jgi:hypothetical protein
MRIRNRSLTVGIAAAAVLAVSTLAIGASAASGTHVKASGLWASVVSSGYGTNCSYWFSVEAHQTDGDDDYVTYQVVRVDGSVMEWDSGDMYIPGVLSGGPGRVTMSVDTDEVAVDVVLTPNGQYSMEMSGRVEEQDGSGVFYDSFTGHRTQSSADFEGAFAISGWEPPACDTADTFGGWIGTERGTHTYR